MSTKRITSLITVTLFLSLVSAVLANEYDLSWSTIDSGGAYSTGGAFELEGAIGQPDAGPGASGMSGGSFQLVGGFWPLPATCACPGDTNADGVRDGRDIQAFVNCMTTSSECDCANVDGAPGVEENDVSVFVTVLLLQPDCP